MTVMLPKRKHREPKQVKFGGKSTDKSGDSGTKRRKHHLNAQGMPGTPQGVCIAVQGKSCSCGGHNKS